MDKIIIHQKDYKRLESWRDEHKEEVRSMPAPLKAVNILLPDVGCNLKCIRSGSNLKFYIGVDGVTQFVAKMLIVQHGGLKQVGGTKDIPQEVLESCLTTYSTAMAFMTYADPIYREDEEEALERKPHKPSKDAKKQRKKNATYIIRTVGGKLRVAQEGHHASPKGTFSVRGHYRHYKNGKVVWIAEYKKGEGKKKAKTYKIGGRTKEEKKNVDNDSGVHD